MWRSIMLLLPAAGVLLLGAAGLMTGQTFDAASVKSAGRKFGPGGCCQMNGGPGTSDPGRISYNQNLLFILTTAWGVPADQLAGSEWLRDFSGQDSYAITATMPADTTREQFQKMLQNLLIERFQIKLHHETRNFPGYELVVAPGGRKFKETTQDPSVIPGPPGIPQRKPDGSYKLPPGPQSVSSIGPGTFRAQYQAKSMTEFVSNLGPTVGFARGLASIPEQPRVLDKTGLTAKYDFTVEFDCRGCAGLPAAARASLPLLAGRGGGDGASAGNGPDAGSGLPDIFAAFQKQLGLKLVKVKDIPLDVVVFDRIEKIPLPD
jgi:uncharacterized protein (TIGR03435 family)